MSDCLYMKRICPSCELNCSWDAATVATFARSGSKADKMRVANTLAVLVGGILGLVEGVLVTHDETFIPDHVLRVTKQNISVACESRYSVVINGTSPGPTLRLTPGTSAWIRVYNDMADSNLTMVRIWLLRKI